MISCIDTMERRNTEDTNTHSGATTKRSQRELQCRSKFNRQYTRWPNNTNKKKISLFKSNFPNSRPGDDPKIFDLFLQSQGFTFLISAYI